MKTKEDIKHEFYLKLCKEFPQIKEKGRNQHFIKQLFDDYEAEVNNGVLDDVISI